MAGSSSEARVDAGADAGIDNLTPSGPYLVPVEREPDGVCDPDGWCWQNPKPVGDRFYALSGDGSIAVGEHGIVFAWPDHYLPSPTQSDLTFVERQADEIWTGNTSGLWHFDGQAWTRELDALNDFALSPGGQPWALVGNQVMSLTDGQWTTLNDLSLAAGNRIVDFVATDAGPLILTSSYMPKGPAMGELGLISRNVTDWTFETSSVADSGEAWRLASLPTGVVAYSEGAAVYDVGRNWQHVIDRPAGTTELWQLPDGRYLSSGPDGLYAFDAEGSRLISSVGCSLLANLEGGNLRCASQSDELFELEPSATRDMTSASEPLLEPTRYGSLPTGLWAGDISAWGPAPDDVWRAPLDHYDGETWTSYADAAPAGFHTLFIEGSASDDVWFAGTYPDNKNDSKWGLIHFDGAEFSVIDPPDRDAILFVRALRSFGASDTWLVQTLADETRLVRYDGSQWSLEFSLPTYVAYANLVGTDSDSLLVTVADSVYLKRDGQWSAQWTTAGYPITSAAWDGAELWLVAQQIYQARSDGLVARGYGSYSLSRIELTKDRVFYYSGTHYRTFQR